MCAKHPKSLVFLKSKINICLPLLSTEWWMLFGTDFALFAFLLIWNLIFEKKLVGGGGGGGGGGGHSGVKLIMS